MGGYLVSVEEGYKESLKMPREISCCYMGRFGRACRKRATFRVSWAEQGKAPYDTYIESCREHVGQLLEDGHDDFQITRIEFS